MIYKARNAEFWNHFIFIIRLHDCVKDLYTLTKRTISRIIIWKVTLECRCNSLLFWKLFAVRSASRKHSGSFIQCSRTTWLSSFFQGRKILSRCDQKTHIIGRCRKLLLEERLFDVCSYVEYEFIFRNCSRESWLNKLFQILFKYLRE